MHWLVGKLVQPSKRLRKRNGVPFKKKGKKSSGRMLRSGKTGLKGTPGWWKKDSGQRPSLTFRFIATPNLLLSLFSGDLTKEYLIFINIQVFWIWHHWAGWALTYHCQEAKCCGPWSPKVTEGEVRLIEENAWSSWHPFSSSSCINSVSPPKASKRKRKQVELEPEIRVPGLDCDRSLPEGINWLNNVVLEVPERGLCFTDEYGNPAFQRWSDMDRAGIKAMLGYIMMASPIKSAENMRLCLDLKAMIEEHPDKHLLRSKKAKLEALGYHLNIWICNNYLLLCFVILLGYVITINEHWYFS